MIAKNEQTKSKPSSEHKVKANRQVSIGEAFSAYILIAPATIFLVLLFLAPTLSIFAISVTDWEFGARNYSFVGIENFIELFRDKEFRSSFYNTLKYVIIVVPGTVISGLLIAILIESKDELRSFYRAVHFLPYMATMAAMAIAWEALLHPTIGLVNQVLSAAGMPVANWLRDETTVLPVLAFIGIWQNLGFAMVLYLAGLKAIPSELYDAAEIDGADGWFERFRNVTLPMLGPVSMFVVIVVALKAFQTFDTVQILTQGGPGDASQLLMYTLYRESFTYLRTGYGAALTLVFLLIVVTLTLLQARVADKKVHYS